MFLPAVRHNDLAARLHKKQSLGLYGARYRICRGSVLRWPASPRIVLKVHMPSGKNIFIKVEAADSIYDRVVEAVSVRLGLPKEEIGTCATCCRHDQIEMVAFLKMRCGVSEASSPLQTDLLSSSNSGETRTCRDVGGRSERNACEVGLCPKVEINDPVIMRNNNSENWRAGWVTAVDPVLIHEYGREGPSAWQWDQWKHDHSKLGYRRCICLRHECARPPRCPTIGDCCFRAKAAIISNDIQDFPIAPVPSHGGNWKVPCKKWSMSIEQWIKFLAYCKATADWRPLKEKEDKLKPAGYVNGYDLNDAFVKPWTKDRDSSVALLMNPTEDQLREAQLMVSHAWGEDMEECEDALVNLPKKNKHVSAATRIYFCIFSNYQHNDSFGPSIKQQVEWNPFGAVINSPETNGMVVILTTASEIYLRLWCVYEIDLAISRDQERRQDFISVAPSRKFRVRTTRNWWIWNILIITFCFFAIVFWSAHWLKNEEIDHDVQVLAKYTCPAMAVIYFVAMFGSIYCTKRRLRVDTRSAKAGDEDTEYITNKVNAGHPGGFDRLDQSILDFRMRVTLGCVTWFCYKCFRKCFC